jgi:hypothetical protein
MILWRLRALGNGAAAIWNCVLVVAGVAPDLD